MFGLAMLARIAFVAQTAAVPTPKDGKVIVRLVSRHNDISAVATRDGVRYSAVDKSGQTLVTNASLDDLKQQHPDLYRQVTPAFSSTKDQAVPYAGAD